ncbi:putative sporulation protein [Clostridium pasteurianum DSM 525 = ATCC 6013]|uniref:Putative sporulation protein n=1 Tax=Clostridium pasteurianum DSM 525 = ATCC 6013 TaxID=1262449 RepID=A0A0H3J8C0_CLOPA|nr:spore protease YyaC [Clostridium pasteurianum]AJA50116.1 putative sporulation protein [Clostridium pasteurianum DSM 525 = ATCC 6013]AJA54104.1 putative sporulation protein [Clostridium pasteurianum DSM 525 = ATCC 6013]AOZ77230.1 sporulation protein [Clostridium pasteurianum DSM 525 = ATCC 6013]AOZ81026.1 sporulation protein [Clostridium pasteurianum]ELP59185.1 hypothetical protein F502_09893 [Clostridium pasteurianum DSM 525 = ATCC 6013]
MVNKVMIDSTENNCIFKIRDTLSKEILSTLKENRPIILLCIGTDRSTGDSLGPLVGDKLNFLIRDHIFIYGNLKSPIHAKNLCDTITKIKSTYKNPYIIAVDACLGSIQNVGKIIIENKPVIPGAAMNKDLPPVGNLSITGIVNIAGSLEFMVLQNTRLYVVMHLADMISKGIYHSIIKTVGGKRNITLNT